ncbi:polysaccharide lyase family 8 super-sandwich domain-containing protein [Paenibacillus sp. HB172176]|uniref:polysaccharide lyase family 8 super-sandwich domain-containing protein n=1 Tax=Paenibacillus sp. HB172176 TaxID=2493690 RepID=UPI001438D6E3|nr:polysaccharide lyase family 8 super-sandwich domain-containing protein [Paenibacillus sp. HB172176]
MVWKAKRWPAILLVCVMLASMLPFANEKAFASDEYDALRAKWKEMITGGTGYSTGDADIAAKLDEIEDAAQSNWDTLNTDPSRTRLWSSLGSGSADVRDTYRKLKDMALGYATYGSTLEGDTDLRDDIVDAMDWMYANNYNETTPASGNWWDWEIGTPLALNDLVILMYDDLTSTQIANYMTAIEHFSPGVELSGANRVWKVTVVGVRGIIVKDSAKLYKARDGLGDVFEYSTDGDGFYTDGSFIQHGVHPYTGGYGKNLISDIANMMYVLDGSTWEVVDTRKDFVARWVYDSFEPLVYNGAMMDMSRGREISRNKFQDHVVGHYVMQALIRISQFAPFADKLAIQSMIKAWIADETYSNFYEDASINMIVLAKAIMSDSSIVARDELVGNYLFPQMDRAVQLREGFGYAVSMSSTRISNYESINAENARAWHTADGMTYLYNADQSQFSDDFWPTVNPYRLPGTTVEQNSTVGSHYGGSNEVGGASLGEYGVIGMRLMPYSQTLDAKKSWFMFDDEIVALGSDIASTDGSPVETIVENRKLNASGNNAFTVDGTAKSTTLGWSESLTGVDWAHLDGNTSGSGIGYYFPDSSNLEALREARTGKWKDLNSYKGFDDTTLITRNYLTLYVNHGTDPTAGSYSYVTLPNATTTETSAYASSPDIDVLENSDEAQAVEETTLGIKAAQFWQNSSKTVGGITSDSIASVMVEDSGGELAIAVADPTQVNTGSIGIELSGTAACVLESDPAITVQQLSPSIQLSVNANGSAGASRLIKLKKTGTCSGITQTTTYEVEDLPYDSSGDTSTVYHTDAAASGGEWRWYAADSVGDYIENAIDVPESGTYEISVRLKKYNSRGITQLSVQGVDVGSGIDGYASSQSFQTMPVGTISFEKGGPKTIRFTVTGKNASSSGYGIPLDSIILVRTGPSPSSLTYEAEDLTLTGSAGDTFGVYSDSSASGGKVTKLIGNTAGDYISHTVNVAVPGTYRIHVRVKKYSDRGQFQLYLDGKLQGNPQDEYSASSGYRELDLGVANFTQTGNHEFKFTLAGTSGSGLTLVFDKLTLSPE